jgi:hypothetical protein
MQHWDKSKDEKRDAIVRQTNKRKSTAKWCKGKEGREHVTEIVLNHNLVSFKRPCGWRDIWTRRGGERVLWKVTYSCRHSLQCVNCGKYVVYYLQPEQCPDFKPKPA